MERGGKRRERKLDHSPTTLRYYLSSNVPFQYILKEITHKRSRSDPFREKSHTLFFSFYSFLYPRTSQKFPLRLVLQMHITQFFTSHRLLSSLCISSAIPHSLNYTMVHLSGSFSLSLIFVLLMHFLVLPFSCTREHHTILYLSFSLSSSCTSSAILLSFHSRRDSPYIKPSCPPVHFFPFIIINFTHTCIFQHSKALGGSRGLIDHASSRREWQV